MGNFIDSIISRLSQIFDPESLGEMMADGIANLVVGLAVMAAFVLAWLVLRLILKPALERSRVDKTSISFVMTVAKYGLLGIGIVTALDAAGIRTSAVLASLGIAGLTIGFAARDALSNLISGILIFLDRPFVIGDLVEIEDFYGRVDRITLRSTRIITSDGKMLAVPNAEVINKTVASYTNFPHLRLDVDVTIAVTEDIDQIRNILLDVVNQDPEYLKEPSPRAVVTQLNDYNVALQLQAWLKDERQHIEKRFALREKIFSALTQAGVEMPFETIQIAPLRVNLGEGANKSLSEA
jgi:small conductance mechanosensitive channel